MKVIKLKSLSDLFWLISPNMFFFAMILGMVTGVLYALLIPFILYAVGSDIDIRSGLDINSFNMFNSPTAKMAEVFLYVCIGVVLIRTVSMSLSAYLANKASSMHRLSICQKIKQIDLLQLERIGYPTLNNYISIDVPTTSQAAIQLPIVWYSAVTVIGSLSYIVYLDMKIFVFVLASLVFGILTYQLPSLIAGKYMQKTRVYFDDINNGFWGLVQGAKELKLNRDMSDRFYAEELVEPEEELLSAKVKSDTIFIFTENYGGIISFLVISVVVFHLPYVFEINKNELYGIVMALLFLTGPVGMVLNSMGVIKRGKVSLRNVRKLYPLLVEEETSEEVVVSDPQIVRVDNLSFKYPGEGDNFVLKDISVEMKRGEVVFLVGGNGSGKSTLAKCLSLHYHPNAGGITFDGIGIGRSNILSARQYISAIYSDFYLFKKIYVDKVLTDFPQVEEYLELLDLNQKVSIKPSGEISSISLSSGQRKRLALLIMLLEDRPICIFDEWAADQDPRFKDIFYNRILQSLRQKGKLVIVISHDDRYYSCADKLVTMENGEVLSVTLCGIQRSTPAIGPSVSDQQTPSNHSEK